VTTLSSRRQHLQRALQALEEDRSSAENYRLPLRKGMVLPVIEVPLEVPVLNAESFRIAPQLEDHPSRDLVKADPDSVEAQLVISDLVRKAHRYADQLKENLLSEGGQTQPGVITRDGVLINANTRCVLLRELQREGRGLTGTLRVAVLPQVITNNELLELEMVLQQQIELKDEYRLVNRLMMIKRLHDKEFTDEQIARTLRTDSKGRGGAARIKEERQVLRLMERARRLTDPPLALTAFGSDVGQYQNWQELLREVNRLDENATYAAADEHIKQWLLAYFAGVNSVHKLRFATDDWAKRDGLVEAVADSDDLSSILKKTVDPQEAEAATPDPDDDSDLGLDLLGGNEPAASPTPTDVDAILNFVAKASGAGDEHIDLPNGNRIPASEAVDQVRQHVEQALDSAKRRKQAGGRLERPLAELDRARLALRNAVEAVRDVSTDEAFTVRRRHALSRAEEVRELAANVIELLADGSDRTTVPTNGRKS